MAASQEDTRIVVDDNNTSIEGEEKNERISTRKRKHRQQPVPGRFAGSSRDHRVGSNSLSWECDPLVSLASEEAMLSVVMKYGRKERGMVFSASKGRIDYILRNCRKNRMDPLAACSLRRLHIKMLNPYTPFEKLRLGDSQSINKAAQLFEHAVEDFLRCNNIKYLNEKQQQRMKVTKEQRALGLLTPDFLLKDSIQVLVRDGCNRNKKPFEVFWVEVKMFYGASTIPDGSLCAVGPLVEKCKRYSDRFGPGLIVFKYNCGDSLAERLLREANVLAVGAERRLNLDHLRRQMKKWCADREGRILP